MMGLESNDKELVMTMFDCFDQPNPQKSLEPECHASHLEPANYLQILLPSLPQ